MGNLNILKKVFGKAERPPDTIKLSAALLDRFLGLSDAGDTASSQDNIANTRGYAVYDEMLRDAEVSSALNNRISHTLPTISITPSGDDADAQEAYEFINDIMEHTPGSLLEIARKEMLNKGLVKGGFVADPLFEVVTLPRWGKVKGLRGFTVVGYDKLEVIVNSDGTVKEFAPLMSHGKGSVDVNKVLYYGHGSTSDNRKGFSALRTAYDPWVLKQKLFRMYGIFSLTNAAGFRMASIDDDDFEREADAALDRLKKMAEHACFVKPSSQEIEIQIPSGDAGGHFIKGIRELCNKEIRKGILFDEVLTAEGKDTGSYASKKVSQEDVHGIMLSEGQAFLEAIFTEQLFPMILEANGLGHLPAPLCLPRPVSTSESADLAPILQALASARKDGLLTEKLPPSIQAQIMSRALGEAGIIYDVTDYTPDGEESPGAEEEEAALSIAATPPQGRQRDQLLKTKKYLDRFESEGEAKLQDVWQDILPKLKKAINNALFDRQGNWKSTRGGAIRRAIEESITTGGQSLNSTLTDIAFEGYELGHNDAGSILKQVAGVNMGPPVLSQTAAKEILKNSIYVTLSKRYADITSDIYHVLVNAVSGGVSPRVAMTQVARTLEASGYGGANATTIVRTSLSKAYNQGRMDVFAPLSDPDGVTPGGIIGFRFDATMDNVTTDVCSRLHKKYFRVDDPNLPEPPMDYNCRSVLTPVFSGEEPWDGEWTSLDESASLTADSKTGFGGN
jgi:SPP1 gp7 family putative phage head morphogenesis protein